MIIGTRGSKLALKQVELFIDGFRLKNYKIKIIKTKGGTIKKPLQKIGTAIFTKELDNALLNKKIDVAIHSLKDIPVDGFPKNLEIASIVRRDDPRDCLIGKLKPDALIGTDSIRRQYELKHLHPNVKFKSLRGNIPTRIKKLKNKEYDAIITAKCALDRLNIKIKNRIFPIKDMVPAAGQGAIAVVKRKKDKIKFKKDKLYDCCMLEREFIKYLGGCKKPVGAYCGYNDEYNHKFNLVGLVYQNNKRVLANFSGDKDSVIKDIKKWKTKYI